MMHAGTTETADNSSSCFEKPLPFNSNQKLWQNVGNELTKISPGPVVPAQARQDLVEQKLASPPSIAGLFLWEKRGNETTREWLRRLCCVKLKEENLN